LANIDVVAIDIAACYAGYRGQIWP